MKRPHLLVLLGLIVFAAAAPAAFAKDEWLQVKSKNFNLVGNASEKDIRRVGTKLEQFRETFRLIFSKVNMTSPIPTNVVVFKSDAAFKPFKPKRSDGKIDNFIAGFFQPGDDVNYIIVSAEGNDADMYGTIFHEYVHSIINTNFGKSEVPPWFNEGLAEYYQTFAIEEDQKVKLGMPQGEHLLLLQQTKLIPLEQLFRVTGRQLLNQGSHSRSIFYAESWALIHYLIQGGKSDQVGRFLVSLLNDTPPDKAFQDAFQMNYAQMEAELRKYVGKNTYQYHQITFKNKLTFDTEMQAVPFSEAESNARLGDVLYHTNRADDAEPFLAAALKLDPVSAAANTTLGMVKIRQRKFDEAKQYLEKATATDQKSHLALYQYAYLLSREGRDEFGYVREFPKETAEKMRELLKKAIALKPDFAESYELMAFVNLVNNEQIDESVTLLQRALKYQPGNQRYAIRIAELFARQEKFDEAEAIAKKISETTDDENIRSRAESLVAELASRKQIKDRMAALQNAPERATGPMLRRGGPAKQLSEEQLKKLEDDALLRSINESLREPETGEQRVLGYVDKIACKGNSVTYTVRTGESSFALASKDFQTLSLNSNVADADNAKIGCGEDISTFFAVITFKEAATNGAFRGDLVAIEFVPKTFRLMTKEERQAGPPVIITSQGGGQAPAIITSGNPADIEQARRDMMIRAIKEQVRQPAEGEKRDIGYLEKVECTPKGVFFNFKTPLQSLRLINLKQESLAIRVFTPDLSGVQFGCNSSVMDFPAVVVYLDKPDKKLKSSGEIVSLEFVPKNFTLD